MTGVLVAHRYPAMCAGLEGGLAQAQGIEVVGAVSRGEEALRLILELQPDVALVACSLAGMVDGVAVAEGATVAARRVCVLAFSAPGDDGALYRLWQAGAVGCVSERAELEAIVQAVAAVARGERLWTPKQMAQAQRWWDEVGQRWEWLTQREREVLILLAEGLTGTEVAERLGLCRGTVKNYLTTIYANLQVSSRAQAVAWAWRYGLVKAD